MNFVTRAINVLAQPKLELHRAAAEPATTSSLILGYALLLAALPAVGNLLGTLLFAGSYLGSWIAWTLVESLFLFLLRDLGLTILIGVIAAALAPNFGGQNNKVGGMKLAVYAATPIWLVSALGALLPNETLYYLLLIIGFGYAAYLVYVGCRPLLAIPDAQAPAVAGIITVIWLVLYILIGALLSRIVYSGTYYSRR
jgi:hypothetical protein